MKSIKIIQYISTIMAFTMTVLMFVYAGQAIAQTEPCGNTVWTLTAGQHIKAGTVTVQNDADNIYVTYAIDPVTYPNATFGKLHMWIGSDLSLLPGGGTSRPAPGKLSYQIDASGLSEYTFTVPLSSINLSITPVTCPYLPPLYVVTHAETRDSIGGILNNQTAFGGNIAGAGKSWWFYGQYTICCDFTVDPQPCFTETAFSKGTHVWTMLKQSNPENLPSLKLTNNRWGWAINIRKIGTNTYPIWAGAGLNNTAKGIQVGTLTVVWDGVNAKVTYIMNSGNSLEEVHVYAADAKPTTVAPGQYGYPAAGYDVGGVNVFSTIVPLKDTDGKDGVWLIAHAVVSGGQCQ